MKQSKIIAAYLSLERLYAEKLPLKDAYKIYKLKKKLEVFYNFQVEKEQEFIRECEGTIDNEGRITFKEANAESFMEKMKELNNIENEIDFDPITISLDTNICITPEEIDTISEFINFV